MSAETTDSFRSVGFQALQRAANAIRSADIHREGPDMAKEFLAVASASLAIAAEAFRLSVLFDEDVLVGALPTPNPPTPKGP